MRRFHFLVAALVLAFLTLASVAAQTKPAASGSTEQTPAASSTAPAPAAQTEQPKVTAYTLPRDLYKKAHDRGRIHFRLNLIEFVYGLVVLWVILHWKLAPKYRDWAERFRPSAFFRRWFFRQNCFWP